MTYRHSNRDAHEQVLTMLPWYVNGTLGELDAQRVDAHLQACVDCSNDLALELSVYRGMTAERAVEYMPAASLKRLQARLDGVAAPAAAKAAADAGPTGTQSMTRSRRSIPWVGVMAASVAVMAVALGLLTADRWQSSHSSSSQPRYFTVTTAIPRPQSEVIRAVFSPAITLNELQGILDEAQLKIVSGPTEAGVYSLAAKSSRPVKLSLALLRGHAKVRFAESTELATGPGALP